jgi:hypothetical protein
MVIEDKYLTSRGKQLEESFFAKQNRELLEKLREEGRKKALKEALAEQSGITDEAVLDKLVEADVCVERVAALALVPLVEVAWADGTISPKEREAILKAAEARGVARDSLARQLLDNWLDQRPAGDLMATWKDYVGAFAASLEPAQRSSLKHDLLDRARAVAEAAGGFLGIGSISAEEKKVLAELETAFE